VRLNATTMANALRTDVFSLAYDNNGDAATAASRRKRSTDRVPIL
jgi:hypothetical protein